MGKRKKTLTVKRLKRYAKLQKEASKFLSGYPAIAGKHKFYSNYGSMKNEDLLNASMNGLLRRPWRKGKFKKGNTAWKLRKKGTKHMAGYSKRKSYGSRKRLRKFYMRKLARIK